MMSKRQVKLYNINKGGISTRHGRGYFECSTPFPRPKCLYFFFVAFTNIKWSGKIFFYNNCKEKRKNSRYTNWKFTVSQDKTNHIILRYSYHEKCLHVQMSIYIEPQSLQPKYLSMYPEFLLGRWLTLAQHISSKRLQLNNKPHSHAKHYFRQKYTYKVKTSRSNY